LDETYGAWLAALVTEMRMYAVIETGGKQYRVQAGDVIDVELLEGEAGSSLNLERVLLVAGEGETQIGAPTVEGAVVKAEVVDHRRGEKIIVYRFKSKVRYRRKTGHRQHLTRLRITDVALGMPQTRTAKREEEKVDGA
jgi:large subunit ribosomal protein L21